MHSTVLEEQFPRYPYWSWCELHIDYCEIKSRSQLLPVRKCLLQSRPGWSSCRCGWLYQLWVSRWLSMGPGVGGQYPSLSTTGLVISWISPPQGFPTWDCIPQLLHSSGFPLLSPRKVVTGGKILPSAGEETVTTAIIKVPLFFFNKYFIKHRKWITIGELYFNSLYDRPFLVLWMRWQGIHIEDGSFCTCVPATDRLGTMRTLWKSEMDTWESRKGRAPTAGDYVTAHG